LRWSGFGASELLFFGPDGSLMSVKYHNIKIWFRYSESIDKPIVSPQFSMILDLGGAASTTVKIRQRTRLTPPPASFR